MKDIGKILKNARENKEYTPETSDGIDRYPQKISVRL